MLFVGFNGDVNGITRFEFNFFSLVVFKFVFDANFSIRVLGGGDGDLHFLRFIGVLDDLTDQSGFAYFGFAYFRFLSRRPDF